LNLLGLEVDPDGHEPIYRQLRAAIVDAITSGALTAGSAVPSSRSLAENLDVSRSTVNLTYQELVAEGFLVAEERVGYKVHPEFGRPINDQDDQARHVDWAQRMVDDGDHLVHLRKPEGRHRLRYPFVVGAPDPELFPAADWTRALRAAMSDQHLPAVIYDHIDTDDPLLVEQLCAQVLPARGIEATPDQVLVTMGTQNGLHLAAAALVRPGERVAVENPGYPDAAHVFSRAGAELVPCPVDDQGIRLDEAHDVSIVIVTPGHQYPTNVTLSATRRQQLLARADIDDLIVIEDDHNSELRHRGQPVASLKSLDRSGRVVHLGSFSKYFGPGLRLGYVVADAALIAKMRDIRRYDVRHPPGLVTRTMALFIERGDYARGLRRVRSTIRERWEIAVAAVDTHLGWDVAFPAGGASLWLPGPPTLDATVLVEEAADRGVFVETCASCYLTDPVPNNIVRLGLSGLPTTSIAPGIEQLARVAEHQSLSRSRSRQ
jgi:GntR family transcriptional regulator/MocR family aminotransferase